MEWNEKIGSAFDVMDRLWDIQKIMSFTYYFVFMDVLFILFYNKGILQFSLNNKPDLSLADIFGFILIFGIFSSLLLQIISMFFSYLLIDIKYRFFKDKDEDFSDCHIYRRDTGTVSLYELKEETLINQSEFLYDLFNKKTDELLNTRKTNNRARIVSVGLVILISAEWYLSWSKGVSQSFIGWIGIPIEGIGLGSGFLSVNFICFLIFLCYSISMCWPRYKQTMVYYPPLYNKLKKEAEGK